MQFNYPLGGHDLFLLVSFYGFLSGEKIQSVPLIFLESIYYMTLVSHMEI